MSATALSPDPAHISQAVFRAVMDAMASPGEVRPLATSVVPPHPLSPTTAAIVRALIDYETPVWLDAPLAESSEVAVWLRFETGAPIVSDPARAAFALIADPLALPPLSDFALGSDDYPDRATTLLIQVAQFGGGSMTLSGPGLAQPRVFSAAPLPPNFTDRLIVNRALFPRGVDVVLVGDGAVAALPRSVRVESRRI